jgi:polygalacturonase
MRTSRRDFLARVSLPTMAAVAVPNAFADVEVTRTPGHLNVRDFGARGDGVSLDTAALQEAIDTCAQSGGGTVYFPPGRFLSGSLVLRSRVTVDLDNGATLLGSTKLEDYPTHVAGVRSYTDNYTERSLIYGEALAQISLQGRGTIDGQGAAFKGPYKVRPYLIRLIGCKDVSVRELTLRDSPMWVQHYLACEGVCIDGITVVSKCNGNNDGIDIDGCNRVRISNCDIQSGDDAIVLKSTLARVCRNVVITNCILNSDCNAFKLGTESNGGFEDIVLSNCVMYDTHLAGIALEMVDGGALARVNVSNVTMKNVRCPLFVRLGNRARPFESGSPKPGMGTLRDVIIRDVQATGANRTGCSIAGLPEHPVENVSLSNIRLTFAGGGKAEDAQRQVPEKADAYPEYSMFGVLPAYGLYCRHVRNLTFDNVEVGTATSDGRPSLGCDDVTGMLIRGWNAVSGGADVPAVRFEDVTDASVERLRAPSEARTWLRVGGKNSGRIALSDTALKEGANRVEIGPEVPKEAVR